MSNPPTTNDPMRCPFCGSRANVIDQVGSKLATCPTCGHFLLNDEALRSLQGDPSWPRTRKDLALALRWAKRTGMSLYLPSADAGCQLIELFDKEEREYWPERAADALEKAGPVDAPWNEPLWAVASKLDLTRAEAGEFVQNLVQTGAVRVEPCEPDPPNTAVYPKQESYRWVKCK